MGWDPEERPEDRMSFPYRLRAPGQRHRDGPISKREQRVWWIVYGVVGAIVVASLVYWLTH